MKIASLICLSGNRMLRAAAEYKAAIGAPGNKILTIQKQTRIKI